MNSLSFPPSLHLSPSWLALSSCSTFSGESLFQFLIYKIIHAFTCISGCRYCAIAKATLKELRVPFTEIDVTETDADPASAGVHTA